MSKRVVMLYPRAGAYGAVFRDLPLGLLQTVRVAHDKGYDIKIIDQRVINDWKFALGKELKKDILCFCTSAMTGTPIKYALEVSKFVREKRPDLPIIWGGIHPTIETEQTLENPYIDIIVNGDGEFTFYELLDALENGKDLSNIRGIAYKKEGKKFFNERRIMNKEEINDLPDIPYDLVDVESYLRNGFGYKVFSINTSMGCPHKCGFCYVPAFYNGKWAAQEAEKALDHIKLVMDKYKPNYVYICDNDFFVDLKRSERIFNGIIKENYDVKLGFRGTRTDEVARMDAGFMDLMEKAGAKHFHIGAESGSQRMLDMMDKGTKVEHTFIANKKFSKYPAFLPTFNIFVGLPGESMHEVQLTTDMALKLVRDNPYGQITAINQYLPYPGTPLYPLALKNGFVPPKRLEGWSDFGPDNAASVTPWVTEKQRRLFDTLYFTSFFLDDKMSKNLESKDIKFRFIRGLSKVYKPIAKFRFKNHFSAIPVEVALNKYYFRYLESLGG